MVEIHVFKVTRAEAERTTNGIKVKLFYPINPSPLTDRLGGNIGFGIGVFETLLRTGRADIANKQNPLRPPSGGSVYLFKDGKIACHRRDKFAPTHKLFHSIPGGFPSSNEDIFSVEGLRNISMREAAEECVLITRDKTPWLVVPKDAQEQVIRTAEKIGLGRLKQYFIDVETLPSNDELEVYYEDGEPIYKTRATLDLIYESEAGMTALWVRFLNIDSSEIRPVDGEGVDGKDGQFKRFNREAYLLDPANLGPFGSILEQPEVYKARIEQGVPEIYVPEYQEPHLGPDKVEVIHPHVFAPDDMLTCVLDRLGIDDYKGKSREIELEKERAGLSGRLILPRDVLIM